MGHLPRLIKGKSICTALLNSADAAKHDVATGDTIRVTSRAGAINIKAVVVDSIMPGVVSIPHGHGEHSGVNVNELTDPNCVDQLSGNAILNGVPVRIERQDANQNS